MMSDNNLTQVCIQSLKALSRGMFPYMFRPEHDIRYTNKSLIGDLFGLSRADLAAIKGKKGLCYQIYLNPYQQAALFSLNYQAPEPARELTYARGFTYSLKPKRKAVSSRLFHRDLKKELLKNRKAF